MKMLLIQFCLAYLLVAPSIGAPSPKKSFRMDNEDIDPEEIGGNFEGDMELNYLQRILVNNPDIRTGKIQEKYRWPGNVVYYDISKVFDGKHVDHIHLGIKMIENATCIKFFPKNKETRNYVLVTGKKAGCHTKVGYHGGLQELNLQIDDIGKGCFRIGSVIHEFIHALGFYHQQSAVDRDDFITIVKKNIKKGKHHNFTKRDRNEVTDFGVGYDYDSVMHYKATAFSRNGQMTIVPKDPGAQIGQRVRLSEADAKKINLMYNCAN